MPKNDPRPPGAWLTCLTLITVLLMTSQAWGQPLGMGRGGMGGHMGGEGMGGPPGPGGGGPGRRTQPKFDLQKAITLTGKVESLGSYGVSSWRSMSGMAVQGLVLKTEQGNINVYLGPPSYVTKQNFPLQQGDTLQVEGFKVLHGHQPAFYAAKVKKDNLTLTLLDEHGSPLWKQQQSGRSGFGRGGRGHKDSGEIGDGVIGPGGRGR